MRSKSEVFVVLLAFLAAACGQAPLPQPTRPDTAAPTRPDTAAPPVFSGEEGVLPVWFQGRAATYLYVSSDGGATWRYTQPVLSAMPEVLAIHDAVAIERETLYRTTDGGHTWTATQAGGALPMLLARRGASIQGADFADAQSGWLFGTEPLRPITKKSEWATTPILPFFLRTTDGGRTWSRLDPAILRSQPPFEADR